jgi:hypothetical protein
MQPRKNRLRAVPSDGLFGFALTADTRNPTTTTGADRVTATSIKVEVLESMFAHAADFVSRTKQVHPWTQMNKSMNDYWNDPPEDHEPPECCDEIMDVDDNGRAICSICGKIIEPPPDIEPMPDIELPADHWKEHD